MDHASTLLPEHAALHALWLMKCAGRSMPLRRDFQIEDFIPWLGHLAIMEVQPDGLFARLIGTTIVDYNGADWTNKYMDEAVAPEARAMVLPLLHEVAEIGEPRYDFRCQMGATYRPLHRLVLPLGDETGVKHLLIALYADDEELTMYAA